MNEVVKYHNDLSNQITIKTLNANELNFFMAICSKMKNQKTDEVVFTFQQLKELVNWSNNNNELFVKSLINTNKKLIALNFTLKENRKTIQFVLFPTFTTDEINKTLTVAVNKEFSFLLNNLSSNFTRFELENFTSLTSKYSKYLYKELMKFKNTGYMILTIEKFREKLDIPIKYRMSEIDKFVLTPAKKELSKVFQKFEIKKIKKGREITHIEFYFSLKKEKIKEEIIELSLEQDRIQAEKFMEKIPQFRQTNIEEVNKNLEEINEKKKEEQIIEVTEEEYEKKYQEYLNSSNSNDTATQRRIFKNIVGKQYQIKKKKIYTIEDIPEEKLLSKNKKKLVGSALKMRVEKILQEMNK
jgi:plasmid replication initiation protein